MDWKIRLLGMEGELLDVLQKRIELGSRPDDRERDLLLLLQTKSQLMIAERLEAFYALSAKETAPESAPGTEAPPGEPSAAPEAPPGS